MAEWRFYGCGSASSNRSLQTSYEWIDNETRIQIDFGNGAVYRRCQAEKGIQGCLHSMRHLLLTHLHPDHIIDITRLVVVWKYTPGFVPDRKIMLYGAEITLNAIEELLDHTGLEDTFHEVFHPHVVQIGQTFFIDDHEIQVIPARHIDGAVGYRIHSPSGLKSAFTGDTGVFEGQTDSLNGLDLLVIESSYHTNDLFMHLNLSQAAAIAGACNPQVLALVHFYPEVEDLPSGEIQSIVAASYEGTVVPAIDGLTLQWNPITKRWDHFHLF